MPEPKRPQRTQQESSKEEVNRELDEALEETFPTSDPVAITTPGGPISPDEDPTRKKSGQHLREERKKSGRG